MFTVFYIPNKDYENNSHQLFLFFNYRFILRRITENGYLRQPPEFIRRYDKTLNQ